MKTLAAVAGCARLIVGARRDPRAGAREGQRRHHHEDRARDAPGRRIRQRNRTNVSTDDLRNDAELKKLLDEITPQLVVDAVDELLVMQRGKELGYRMGDEQFSQILTNIRKENKLEDDAAFEAALKQEGLTLPELRKSLERNMIMSRVQQVEVFGRIAITEDECAPATTPTHRVSTPSSITSARSIDVHRGARRGRSRRSTPARRRGEPRPVAAEAAWQRDFVTVTEPPIPRRRPTAVSSAPERRRTEPQIKAILDALKVGGVSEPCARSGY
jgi:hypothetical protein